MPADGDPPVGGITSRLRRILIALVLLVLTQPLRADIVFKADFTWGASPTPGVAVMFTDASASLPTSWQWDFDDPASGANNTSTDRNPQHTFAAQRTYQVKLTIVQNGAVYARSNSTTKSVPVSTVGSAPIAHFDILPTSPAPGQMASFSDSSTGSPTSWSWDFGDGSGSDQPSPTHAFAAAQDYTVTLRVANSQGPGSTSRSIGVRVPPPPQFAEFAVPTQPTLSLGTIAPGPDGNLWAATTLATVNGIVRISPNDHSMTVFTLPQRLGNPEQYRLSPTSPDDHVWFTERDANKIARISPSGVITEFPVPTPSAGPDRITTGSDGNLWFTERFVDKIGRITTSGEVTEFPIPFGDFPVAIALGSDGNVWFTAVNRIGRITPTGSITEFPATTGLTSEITPGPDGNLWFTAGYGIGRITTAGKFDEFAFPNRLGSITAGPDGNLWFTELDNARIGRITPQGSFLEESFGVATFPTAIALGPDGNIWVVSTIYGTSEISRVTPSGHVDAYPAPGDTAQPITIVQGPDNALWFLEVSAFKVGRVTSLGEIAEFPLRRGERDDNRTLAGIATGPDGNIWVTDGAVTYLTPSGEELGQSPYGGPHYDYGAIVTGPDENLWFLDVGGNRIERTTTSYDRASFPIPTSSSVPSAITAGPDGNLWFTERDGNKIGQVSTEGSVREFAIPTASSAPAGIATGPDGKLWFTEQSANKIGQISTSGSILEFVIPTASSAPTGITAGPDGNLWFTERDANQIGRITPSGSISEFPIPTPNAAPTGIANGSDGNIWFAQAQSNKVGKLILANVQDCVPGPSTLCLNNGRFRVEVSWSVPSRNRSGTGNAVSLTADTGYFWFLTSANIELVIKVLDAGGGNFWVFYGGLSGVQYTITVTDTQTGAVKTYENPSGHLASIADTSAFTPTSIDPEGPNLHVFSGEPDWATEALYAGYELSPGNARADAVSASCTTSPTTLCLNQSRFQISIDWAKPSQNRSGHGTAIPVTSDTGYFWFFNSANVELVIKVLDGRPVNGHFWVFYGALSNVQYTITVTDTETGAVKTYTNQIGSLTSVADTSAF